jgi:RNA polymerase sigma factor (sigma-70 family)
LVKRHERLVHSALVKVLSDPTDVEDAFQATFLVLVRKARSVKWEANLGTWLYAVAHRVAVHLRGAAEKRSRGEGEAATRKVESTAAPDLSWREACQVLHAELDRLPDKFRFPLLLCYLEGKSRDEAAEQLGLSAGTIKGRLERGRNMLRDRLARRGVTLSAGFFAALAHSPVGASPPRLTEAALAAVSGAAPARAAAIARGVTASMVLSRLKLFAGALLAAGLLAGLLAGQNPSPAAASPPAPAEKTEGKAASPQPDEPAKGVEITGRVLGPDDKPVAGARLFLAPWGVKKEDLKVLAATGNDGRFRAPVSDAAVRTGAKLVAVAKDHGPDWLWLGQKTAAKEFTLRLVKDDVPVTGRVLDLEGRPVAGASVSVLFMQEVDLKPWLADPKHSDLAPTGKRYLPTDLDGPASVMTTDKGGRFRLTGFGRDRVAHLQIRGAGVEDTDVEVITRPGKVDGLHLESRTVYPLDHEFVVRPSKPIVGTVRDRKTGKPIAGIEVVFPNATWTWARATTDEKGGYRIDGVGKQNQYSRITAGGLAYFSAAKTAIADTPGFEPLVVDFELDRGVVVKGRLTDAATGKPVPAQISYGPAADNPNLKDFTDLSASSGRTAEDGSFTVLAIPGPGLLVVFADDADHYPSASAGVRTANGLEANDYQGFARIDPDPKDDKSLRCDIALPPGHTLDGKVVDPNGKPLSGARVAGLRQRYAFGEKPEKLAADSFTVAGLGATEPRVLVFAQPEKKLARVQVVPASHKGPLAVRLEPTGTLVGRVFDGEGKPQSGVAVKATYSFGQTVEGEGARARLPTALRFADSGWPELLNGEATTDADGRFRIPGLVPGIEYQVLNGIGRGSVRGLKLTPGETKDLGVLPARAAE